jgi:hypothetical protein
MTSDPTELRLRLHRAGFDPLPLQGKHPAPKEWQKKADANDDEIKSWGRFYPYATNTGILNRRAPVIDVDILNPDAAEAVEDLARCHFEERGPILVRFGKPPKRAILLRTEEPFKHSHIDLIASNGVGGLIELRCDGNQTVVFGTHPDTHRPYTWHGGVPGDIKLEELPYISAAEARAFLEKAALVVRDFGYQAEIIRSP